MNPVTQPEHDYPDGRTLRQSPGKKRKKDKKANRSVIDLENKEEGGQGGSKEIEQILKQDCNCGTMDEYAKSPEHVIERTQARAKQQRP